MEIQDEWVCEDIWEDYDDEEMDEGGQVETAIERKVEGSKGDSNTDTRGTKHTISPKHASSVSLERCKKHLDRRKRDRSHEDDSRNSPNKRYGNDRGSSKPLKDESRRDKKPTDRSRDYRRDKVSKSRDESRDNTSKPRDERHRGRSRPSDERDASRSSKNSVNDASQKDRDKSRSLDVKGKSKEGVKDQKNDLKNREKSADDVDTKKKQQSSSSSDKRDRSADSKSQDRRDRLKSTDDAERVERHHKSSQDEKNRSVDDKSKSLDEKYPWMSIDCPIDNRKMVRGNNRLLEEEKFPCFGDQQTKEKEEEPSVPLDEKYPWYGIECPADETGTGKHESGNSVDEKYPWNSIDCSVEDSSATENRKNLDEKYPWNSIDCSTGKPNPSLFDCSFCEESFVKQAELNDHMDDEHENEDTYRCSLCKNVRYKVALRLSSHMRVHHQMYNNMVFKDYLEGGIRTFRVREQHLTDELRELQKSVIGTDVWDTDSLEINRSNRNSVEKDVDDDGNAEEDKDANGLRTCSFCMGEESFTTKSKLNSHMNNAHKDVDNLRCCLCDNTFRIVGRLREHLREQHEIKPQMVYMEFLENGWRTLKVKGKFAYAVKRKMQTRSLDKDEMIDPEQAAEDNDMEKDLPARDEAGDRINRKHSRDPDAIPQKRFRCRYCPVDEFFPRKKLLIQHYRSAHNNNKRRHVETEEDHNQAVPYNCAVCKEQFKSRGDLDTHTTNCAGSKKSSQWSVFF